MLHLAKRIRLEGRTALVTGATGKIGRVIVRTLSELGADILLIDHPLSDFIQLRDELAAIYQARIDFIPCDLESGKDRREMIELLISYGRPLDILVNNAAFVGTSGLQGWAESFGDQRIETWRKAIEVNLIAVFELCQGLFPLLKQSDSASIINIGSIYGICGPDWSLYEGTTMANPAAYAASKGGLIQLTRWLATTLAPKVRANAISPGGVWRNQPKSFVAKYSARTPLGRMATEEDLVGVIALLASDLSSYITGQNLVVDGGWSVW